MAAQLRALELTII